MFALCPKIPFDSYLSVVRKTRTNINLFARFHLTLVSQKKKMLKCAMRKTVKQFISLRYDECFNLNEMKNKKTETNCSICLCDSKLK